MNVANNGGFSGKPPDDIADSKSDKKPPVKTLNRVPRACNACRKQKMRCEGADNPPCRRCMHAGLDCIFEKPSREATLTGEAGLERMRNLEAHVFEIRQGQASIHAILADIQAQLRAASLPARSPSAYPPNFHSPSLHSPAVSATPPGNAPHESQPSPTAGGQVFQPGTSSRPRHSYQSSTLSQGKQATNDYQHSQLPPPASGYPPPGYNNNANNGYQSNPQGHALPPFSSIQAGVSQQQGNLSSVRFHPPDSHPRAVRPQGTKRSAHGSSNVTSADSSGAEDDEEGVLPASGLVAPWEVLRGLADVAIQRAAKENGDSNESLSRPRTPSPERQSRPAKRRKTTHQGLRMLTFPDVVTKNIISEAEARELFRTFFHGCSTFLPVFDANSDTYETLHERSPFAFNTICMVAAFVRDGGGKPSETYTRCLEEVQAVSCATLFSPVVRVEAVQAMILVSGWSDNGWLSGGHAVRMGLELSLHKAWPVLYRRIENNQMDSVRDRELVIASRTWFCLYLFEHQLSYGTGRPAILKDDDSIRHCRLLLRHPLALQDDMRLVSTVELMALRERVHNALSPPDEPVRDQDFEELRQADLSFRHWYATWDSAFSQKYEDAAFYRQSLQVQQLHAEQFANATVLRGINGPDDVQKMPPAQREVAIRSIQIARQGLDITVNSPAYAEGMKYAVHYTHATATFAASFLLRLARLFPNECNFDEIRHEVGRLATLLSELPGKRYALTLQVMLKRSKRRHSSHSPKITRDPHQAQGADRQVDSGVAPYSPVYEHPYTAEQVQHMQQGAQAPQQHNYSAEAENIWRGYEMTANELLPVWISDQSLGGNSFGQHGMNAFLLPTDYLPPAPQIW